MASNRSLNLMENAAYTGVQSTVVVTNLNNPSLHVILNISTLSASQFLTLSMIGVAEDDSEYTMFTSLPMNKEVPYRTVVAPWAHNIAGIICNDFVPLRFYFKITPTLPAQEDTYALNVQLGLA